MRAPKAGAIRPCGPEDTEAIFEIVNDAAIAYRGVIPADRWREPYMPRAELVAETADGVAFWGYERAGRLLGVMGLQDKGAVHLIRHAYVRTKARRQGIGGELLRFLFETTGKPVLIGTWAAAHWAIRFYEGHGFRRVDDATKTRLLETYWRIPARQVETSVVLADARWWAENA